MPTNEKVPGAAGNKWIANACWAVVKTGEEDYHKPRKWGSNCDPEVQRASHSLRPLESNDLWNTEPKDGSLPFTGDLAFLSENRDKIMSEAWKSLSSRGLSGACCRWHTIAATLPTVQQLPLPQSMGPICVSKFLNWKERNIIRGSNQKTSCANRLHFYTWGWCKITPIWSGSEVYFLRSLFMQKNAHIHSKHEGLLLSQTSLCMALICSRESAHTYPYAFRKKTATL